MAADKPEAPAKPAGRQKRSKRSKRGGIPAVPGLKSGNARLVLGLVLGIAAFEMGLTGKFGAVWSLAFVKYAGGPYLQGPNGNLGTPQKQSSNVLQPPPGGKPPTGTPPGQTL